MSAIEYRHNEVIELEWPDGNDDGAMYLCGHIEPNEARHTLARECEWLHDTIDRAEPEYPDDMQARSMEWLASAKLEHGYARWAPPVADPDYEQVLRECDASTPGAFAITKVMLWPYND